MVCKHPFDITIISKVLGLPYDKFYRWFKEHLTDFRTEEGQNRLHEHDIHIYINGKHKKIFVPIFRPEHFDTHMAIDEKHIDGLFYTVLSNAKTGKVVLLCSTIKVNELNMCLKRFDLKLEEVRFITLDLSPTFELVATENFPNATHIADKFHVVKNGIEALQAMRTRIKNEVLTIQREEQKTHEKRYKESKDKLLYGPKMLISKAYRPVKLINGETVPELLSRSRYLLAMTSDKWNIYQMKRAKLLFETFPQIEQAYQKIIEFRDWYKAKPAYYEPFQNERLLGKWIEETENDYSIEIRNFSNLVANHEQIILNYHKCGNKTNAIAESINAKIKDAIRKNNGSRDIDFFHYKLALII